MVYCTNCGKSNNDDALFCQYCGVRRTDVAKVTSSAVAVPPLPKPIEAAQTNAAPPQTSEFFPVAAPQASVNDATSRPSMSLPPGESVEKLVNDVNGLVIKMRDIFPDVTEREWVKVAKTGDGEMINRFFQERILPIIRDYDQKMDNPNLNPGEEVLWSHDVHKGLIRSALAERWVITNQRAMIERPATETSQRSVETIGLAVCNVAVMNERRKRNASPIGAYAGRNGAAAEAGSTDGASMVFGDLVFLFSGKEELRFSGISDPDGVRSMVMTLKRQLKV
ncbi:MAG: zinc ribbon domain-containing protein [Methanomassiliicoccus sp.]|nr:zinc ribbon domain-containing protein [Methanomassiliicoccus sp.]